MSDLSTWSGRQAPNLQPLNGRYVVVEPANFSQSADGLFEAISGAENNDLWTHVATGPWSTVEQFGRAMTAHAINDGWKTHFFRDVKTSEMLGMASYMRIRPNQGSAEVGCVVFSKKLQRTAAATEAMYLMARYIFDDLGYRRYEWKCDNANEPSKRAALRLGFRFEGVFRQDMVVKGKNRDTAWFSITDKEWPQVKDAFEAWLSPANFDPDGRQKRSLADIRAAL